MTSVSNAVSEIDRLRDENRRLRAEADRERGDADVARERLAYALAHAAELRRRLPETVSQAAAPGSGAESVGDLLVRPFGALRPLPPGRSRNVIH